MSVKVSEKFRYRSMLAIACTVSLSFDIAHAGVFRRSIRDAIAIDVARHEIHKAEKRAVLRFLTDEQKKAEITKFVSYLKDVEMKTGRKIPLEQKQHLIEAFKQQPFMKRTPNETKLISREFDSKRRKMIAEWEMKTGSKWPKEKSIYDGLSKDKNYDLHHIIPKQHGGPNTWWNSHPALNPDEHQKGIHSANGILRNLQKYYFP